MSMAYYTVGGGTLSSVPVTLCADCALVTTNELMLEHRFIETPFETMADAAFVVESILTAFGDNEPLFTIRGYGECQSASCSRPDVDGA